MADKIGRPYKKCKITDISQGFSYEHPAVDFVSGYGEFLIAPENCIVDVIVSADKLDNSLGDLKRGYGIRLKSVVNENNQHIFWHCMPVFPVKVGDFILKGKPCAQMGNSGSVRIGNEWIPAEIKTNPPHLGTHLHWQYIREGVPTDPRQYIDWELPVDYGIIDIIKASQNIIQAIINLLKNR